MLWRCDAACYLVYTDLTLSLSIYNIPFLIGTTAMPLEAIAINRLDAPLIKKPARDNELAERLAALYDRDGTQPSGAEVLRLVEQGFSRGQYLYVGMFND